MSWTLNWTKPGRQHSRQKRLSLLPFSRMPGRVAPRRGLHLHCLSHTPNQVCWHPFATQLLSQAVVHVRCNHAGYCSTRSVTTLPTASHMLMAACISHNTLRLHAMPSSRRACICSGAAPPRPAFGGPPASGFSGTRPPLQSYPSGQCV